jgi:hypothetical protein
MMNLRKSLIWGGYVLFFMIAFPLVGVLQHRTFAQNPADRSDLRDRVAIQEKLLYAYAYAWDSKDCVGWANLFTADAVVSTAIKATVAGMHYYRPASKDKRMLSMRPKPVTT